MLRGLPTERLLGGNEEGWSWSDEGASQRNTGVARQVNLNNRATSHCARSARGSPEIAGSGIAERTQASIGKKIFENWGRGFRTLRGCAELPLPRSRPRQLRKRVRSAEQTDSALGLAFHSK